MTKEKFKLRLPFGQKGQEEKKKESPDTAPSPGSIPIENGEHTPIILETDYILDDLSPEDEPEERIPEYGRTAPQPSGNAPYRTENRKSASPYKWTEQADAGLEQKLGQTIREPGRRTAADTGAGRAADAAGSGKAAADTDRRAAAQADIRQSAYRDARTAAPEAAAAGKAEDGALDGTFSPVTKTAGAKSRSKKKSPFQGLVSRRLQVTLVLTLLLCAIAGGAAALVYRLSGGAFTTINYPFQASREFPDQLASREVLRSVPFAADLCVVEKNIELPGVPITGTQAALLLNLDKKEVIYSRMAYTRIYPASMTKIMTSILAFLYGNMDDIVTIEWSDTVLEEGSQVCGFTAGDKVSMDQLVHGLLIYSGNDAAMAIARHIGGTVEDFVGMMNIYARQLGCTDTHFVNPHGLHDTDHYTTPYDIYLMLKEALKYPRFIEIAQLSEYVIDFEEENGEAGHYWFGSTDHYLTGEATPPKDVVVLGGKTGTTDEAGNCLALLTQNAYGKPFFSVITGAPTKDLLYQQMNSLLQYINSV